MLVIIMGKCNVVFPNVQASCICLFSLDTFNVVLCGCGSKNTHQKDICIKEIGPCAQDLLPTRSMLVNIIEKDIWSRRRKNKNYKKYIYYTSLKNQEENG